MPTAEVGAEEVVPRLEPIAPWEINQFIARFVPPAPAKVVGFATVSSGAPVLQDWDNEAFPDFPPFPGVGK